jgi:hypothetical protein
LLEAKTAVMIVVMRMIDEKQKRRKMDPLGKNLM